MAMGENKKKPFAMAERDRRREERGERRERRKRGARINKPSSNEDVDVGRSESLSCVSTTAVCVCVHPFDCQHPYVFVPLLLRLDYCTGIEKRRGK